MSVYIDKLANRWLQQGHSVTVASAPGHRNVDVAFFLSYSRIVLADMLKCARSNIVVHGSALPKGKGWSPWAWQIIEGRNRLALTLFEAIEDVDSGPIYDQRWVELSGHELVDEWRERQVETILSMCVDFIDDFPAVLNRGCPQRGHESYYQRRRPEDSRLDPHRSIAEQFGLLRVVDNQRYPAYFEHEGHVYTLAITKRET